MSECEDDMDDSDFGPEVEVIDVDADEDSLELVPW